MWGCCRPGDGAGAGRAYGILVVILFLFILPMAVPSWDDEPFLRNIVAPVFGVLLAAGHGGGG